MARRPAPVPHLRRCNRRREKYFALNGGLNLVDPPINLPPGELISCTNYEQKVRGGYGRIGGFERYDGRPAPSDASYYTLDYVGGIRPKFVYDTFTDSDQTPQSVTLTSTGGVATATLVGHGYATKDVIDHAGADQGEYNGIAGITVTGVDTYTYPISGSPASPAPRSRWA